MEICIVISRKLFNVNATIKEEPLCRNVVIKKSASEYKIYKYLRKLNFDMEICIRHRIPSCQINNFNISKESDSLNLLGEEISATIEYLINI